MEIHVKKDKETLFAYRTDDGKSNIYSKDLNQSINFNAPGVFPVPQVTIKRDIETGGFEYNFNDTTSLNGSDKLNVNSAGKVFPGFGLY